MSIRVQSKLLKYLAIIAGLVLVPSTSLALTSGELKNIQYHAPSYTGTGIAGGSNLCLGGPSGGLHFPSVSNPADLAKHIDDYIQSVRPDSPLSGQGNIFVSLGQKYNVNPAYIVGDAQNETTLGTTGQQTTHNYFGVRSTSPYPSNGSGFAIFPDVSTGLEVYFKLIGGPGYLGPPTSFTDPFQITSKTTPVGDGANNPRAKADQIISIMGRIMAGVSTTDAGSVTASISAACGSGITSENATGWGITGAHAMVSYLQGDPRWGSLPYGAGKTSIAASGCGPTAIAMALATLLGNSSITPLAIANQYGARFHTDGTAWGIFPVVASDYHVNIQQLGPDLTQTIATIKSGGLVVGTFAPGYFTKQGHFMVIRAVSSDGTQFYIADPANASHNTVAYSASFLVSSGQLRQLWTFTK